MKRRRFIQYTAAITGVIPALHACRPKRKIAGSIIGASADIGHLLRDKKFDEPSEIIQKDVVIVGGGVSGLSAARWLKNNGIENFAVIDLERKMGGNAANGHNEISSYPWGAHYIPIPNNDLTEYLSFLEESKVITDYENGLPVYNEYYLCFDPQERLYINGRWQDGLVPEFGVSDKERKQIQEFFQQMNSFRYAKGKDGKDAFAIPVDNSSKDEKYTGLDNLTMKDWLQQQQLDSAYLHWYVNYCTRDDFGTPYNLISAWTGIQYFAGRKGKGANAQQQDVLTWQEGNGFLIKELSKNIGDKFLNNALAVNITSHKEMVRVTYYDVSGKLVKAIDSKFVIVCTPQFVNSRLLTEEQERARLVKEHLSYSPWMVANLKVKELTERQGAPFSWDNVLYNSSSLGYVNACQQLVEQKQAFKNITYYLPLTAGTATAARTEAQKLSHEQWVKMITDDLRIPHPNIEEAIEQADIMIWGHAMAQPKPGTIHGTVRKQLQQPVRDKIFFAHTDLAGISIFEEGFYQGLNAAKEVLKKLEI